MVMMTYRNNLNEVFYDFTMISDIFGVHASTLKREIKNYSFVEDDLIRYKNRYLYSQSGVVDFIVYLVKKKLQTDLSRLERAVDKNNADK